MIAQHHVLRVLEIVFVRFYSVVRVMENKDNKAKNNFCCISLSENKNKVGILESNFSFSFSFFFFFLRYLFEHVEIFITG